MVRTCKALICIMPFNAGDMWARLTGSSDFGVGGARPVEIVIDGDHQAVLTANGVCLALKPRHRPGAPSYYAMLQGVPLRKVLLPALSDALQAADVPALAARLLLRGEPPLSPGGARRVVVQLQPRVAHEQLSPDTVSRCAPETISATCDACLIHCYRVPLWSTC